MKRNLFRVAVCFIFALTAIPALSQAAREATIEPETKARIVLQSQLNSKLNEPGDTVTAVLYEPVYVDNQMVMGRGTEFQGRVTEVKPAGRGLKNGSMAIIFERVVMPWGLEPVAVEITAIDDWDNDEKLKADEEGKVDGKRDGKRTADNVARGGAIGTAGGIATILLGGGSTAGGAGIAGGLLGGLLLTKGGDVKVAPGAVFRIKFVKPMTLPVMQQYGSSPRPIKQEDPPAQVKNP